MSSCAERDMGFDTSDNCLLGRPRALDAMLEQVRAALHPNSCAHLCISFPLRRPFAAPLQCSLSTVPVLPFAAAPTRTQFVNDSSYSRVFAALGAGARAQGRAHIPELQLKVGHAIVGRIWP